MKKLVAKLEKTVDKVQQKCEERDKTALSRSDKWRESTPGQKYEARTQLLADGVFDMRDGIRKIKNALEL